MKIYLDNCASTRVLPEAAKAAWLAMTETYANPSALHEAGQSAERLVKQARHQIAFSLGTKPGNIVFTGSGTEADNLALFSAFHSGPGSSGNKKGRLLVSSIEHRAIYAAAEVLAADGVEVVRIPVFGADTDFPGMVDTAAFRSLLTDDTALVSVLHVSNEIGTIQPIEEMSRIITLYNTEHGTQIKFHVDAVQSYGKLAIDVENGDFRRVDLVSMSAHKLHGPKGVGALYALAPGKLHPMIFGGGQEGGVRSGTENVPGIVGFGVSARVASSDVIGHGKQANNYRRRLLEGIGAEIPDVFINSPADASVTGKAGNSSPYVLSMGFPGTRGEVLVHELEKSGIYLSTGAACSSLVKDKDNKKDREALMAIGTPDEIREGTLRFGISWMNEADEISYVVDKLKKAVERFRQVGVRR